MCLFAVPSTPLIGRSAELQAIVSRLADPARRLLTFYIFSPVELASLVKKSLVRRHPVKQQHADDSTSDDPRFLLLERIREYALAKLIACGEAAVLRRAHALYCLRLAEATAAEWDSPAADANIARLDLVHDNLRAALQWACDGGDWVIGLQLAGTLRRFWRQRGHSSEGRVWLEKRWCALVCIIGRSSNPGLGQPVAVLRQRSWPNPGLLAILSST